MPVRAEMVLRAEGMAVLGGVLAPLWTRPLHWMILGMGILVGAAVIGLGAWLFRGRRRQVALPEVLAVVERERERIAEDLHDDLGTSLTEIALLSTLASRSLASEHQARHHLQHLEKKVDSSVRTLDRIVWAVNPANDCVDSVVTYFCRHARQFLGDASIRCRLDVPPTLPNHVLPPETRHRLFLAFKEALHNVVRHAAATQVTIRIAARRRVLQIAVHDNGCGLPPTLPPAGADGLRNMRRRLERLGGTCVFRSAPGQGLSVQFELPMSRHAGGWRGAVCRLAGWIPGLRGRPAGGGPAAAGIPAPAQDNTALRNTRSEAHVA
ncbi:MAG: hypothetical protein JXQ71_06800 [Verrucomicrobia bacterium]|nr:hypothetical protein [Verrucomicrobiota bacterium]